MKIKMNGTCHQQVVGFLLGDLSVIPAVGDPLRAEEEDRRKILLAYSTKC